MQIQQTQTSDVHMKAAYLGSTLGSEILKSVWIFHYSSLSPFSFSFSFSSCIFIWNLRSFLLSIKYLCGWHWISKEPGKPDLFILAKIPDPFRTFSALLKVPDGPFTLLVMQQSILLLSNAVNFLPKLSHFQVFSTYSHSNRSISTVDYHNEKPVL